MVAEFAVSADSVQPRLELRRAILFLLAPDFTPDRLRHRRRFQSGVLHILAGIAEAVVFADGRLRRIREAVEKMAFGVAGQLPNVQEAIQIASIAELLGITEFAYVAPIFVENYHQVRFTQSRHRHFAVGQYGNGERREY